MSALTGYEVALSPHSGHCGLSQVRLKRRGKAFSGVEANRLGDVLSALLQIFAIYVLRPAASKQQETRLTPRFADSAR